MRDMFDDFMEELRRRQAEEQRRKSGGPDAAGDNAKEEGEEGQASAEEEHAEGEAPSDGEQAENGEPEPIRPRPAFGGLGGPPRRGPRRGGYGEAPFLPGRGWLILIVLFVVVVPLILLFFGAGIGLWTDAIWFQSVGFAGVFWTRIGSQVGFFVLGVVLTLVFLFLNVWIARRLAPRGPVRTFSLDDLFDRFNVERADYRRPGGFSGRRPAGPSGTIEVPDVGRWTNWALAVLAVIVALSLGGLLSSSWQTIQLWLHQVPFGRTDPVFGKDIGFFLFELPFLRLVQSYLNTLVLIALALSGIRYLVAALSGARITTPVRLHLAILAGLYLVSTAAGYQLDKLELVYSNNGVVTGVSATDQAARFFALDAMTVIAALAAAFLIGFAYTGWRVPLSLTVLVWVAAFVLLDGIYPQLYQRLVVVPNQANQEAPWIKNNIDMTRLAYALDAWQPSSYSGTGTLTAQAISQDQATFQNARLWDYRPLGKALDQLQAIRQYYTFGDVDADRYTIGGQQRQVWVAGRELDPSQVASSWVNQHITYTHGIGLAMVPVNEVTPEGQPSLIVRDLPPVSSGGAPAINQPRIYYGTSASDYVIVDAKTPEFDYPAPGSSADQSGAKTVRWTGNAGIKLDTLFSRLLFAARFGDFNLLISDQITADSQLLFHRQLADRLGEIAPFLSYDHDPYLVVTGNGHLVYVQDAYTTSSAFPNAQAADTSQVPAGSGLQGASFNYLRNSVKIVMDAYTGDMSFYVADAKDPIVRAWSGVFPGLFKPLDQMPADIKPHLRYPEDLFDAQTTMYETYHLTDPGKLYRGEDVWQVPGSPINTSGQLSGQSGGSLPLESYYVEMRMPGQANAEFLLLRPMVLKQRPNMISWVAARNDGADYGTVKVFNFPSDTSIYGPQQIEASIDADPTISSQITLWGQINSTVIRGNLIVVPIQNSLIYLEPIYLQSSGTSLPQFKKIVVATNSQVVWGDTLQQALGLLVTGAGQKPGASPSPGTSPSPGPSATPTSAASPTPGTSLPPNASVQQLVAAALQHMQAAQDALRRGDLGTYQRENEAAQQLLQQAQGQLSGASPQPSPSR